MIVVQATPAVLAAMARRLEAAPFPEGTVGFGGIDSQGRLVAACAFGDHRPSNGTIEVYFASWHKRGATPSAISVGLAFAFDTLNCQMVIARRMATNEASGRFMKHLGFIDHFTPRLMGRERDGYMAYLTDDAWRASRFYRKVL